MEAGCSGTGMEVTTKELGRRLIARRKELSQPAFQEKSTCMDCPSFAKMCSSVSLLNDGGNDGLAAAQSHTWGSPFAYSTRRKGGSWAERVLAPVRLGLKEVVPTLAKLGSAMTVGRAAVMVGLYIGYPSGYPMAASLLSVTAAQACTSLHGWRRWLPGWSSWAVPRQGLEELLLRCDNN